ncbi:restriction endonuclease subunit S [Hymenobacter sp. GOD-10R]|uniref:restriction endonuclease subunit S n=1 Tax=Hymenobacter sp. GOD-10R TaxID=3093922 RepID=UPI002D797383|nr:restriction endonuclease subunit S [Hymenobacter sp. GOD-10R]WRQ31936.1 restriction endonuclease subunit S [Hymenobacter sp. GOD-10R]
MSNETKKTALPKLRFPEFRGVGEWEEKALGDVCEVLNNRRKPITGSFREKGQYPYYGASGIVDYVKDFIFDERLLLVGEDGAKWGAFEDTAFIVAGKYWVNNHAHVLRPREINEILLEKYLVKLNLAPYVTGAAPPKLTLGKLKTIPVPVAPTRAEQQKIADALSSLDDLITAQSAKLAALQAHKRGLMQGLFPAEGETVPKVRFPEFQDSEEWEEKTLGDIATFSSGGTPSKDKPEYWDGDTPWVSASSMHDYVIDKSELYITDVAKKAGAAIVGEGVLLLLVRGSMLFKRIPMGITAREVAFNQDVKALHLDKSIAPLYLLYYLVSSESLLLSKVSATGIGAGKLDTSELKQFPVFIPSPAEQERIVECLSSIDDRITAQTQKIQALKLHKKGLMQGLFPALTATEA